MNPSLPEAWQTPPSPRWQRKLGAYWRLMRADRPIGWLLLLWPTWRGLWLAARGWGWGDVYTTFYSDSLNDLALLEKVDQPVATNPDARLRAVAQERGWRILDLFPHA